MKNSEIVKTLLDIADLLELKGESVFKVRAYQKAARSIEFLPVEVERLVAEGRLREVPGIGEAIEKKITELVQTGKLQYYENLKAEYPEGISSLLNIPGVGPRTAALLARELKIGSVEELEEAINQGKVAELYRMGEKTAENILRQIQALRRKKSEQRIPIGDVLPMVDLILDQLREAPGVRNLVAAGSLRRFKETIGDIDLMGTADNPREILRAFTTLPQVKEVIASGSTKASIIVSSGLKVDLRLVEHESFGSLLQYFTGSKQHNINLRERARRMRLSLSEYGISSLETDKLEKFATEEGFYARQGLDYIPPEIREGGNEIALAEKHALPRLIEQPDIKGDFHLHTKWSDGKNSIENMALAAQNLGYQYIGIADHSSGRGIAHGLDVERLKTQMLEIKALNQRINSIHILSGIEVDIRADGSLDIPDEVLKKLDFVIAAVHSGLNQSQDKMTERLIKAIENPHVDMIAHITGRLLPEREPSTIDMEAVFQAAARTRTMLEINAMPDRLDLKDTHAYRARELGVKLVINTDAHNTDQLKSMRFGAGVARRGWCQAQDILNTKSYDEVRAYLKNR